MSFPRRFRSRMLLLTVLAGTALLLTAHLRAPPEGRRSDRDEQRASPAAAAVAWLGRALWPAAPGRRCGQPRPAPRRVDTAEAYPGLDFAVPESGGLWTRELEERYREAKSELPLEVIVVPQSHVDPGWLQTFDDYFEGSVSKILDNMVHFLNKTEDFKFIWAEMSYFSKWWERQSKEVQKTVKTLLNRNQLEFVTGGWVMTDEATTTYFSIIEQLVEGHQWLRHHTGATPHRGWSVDVFGHSASLPYVLSLAGITDTVVLRTHYAWKALMARMRWFEFYWDQPFDAPRILCHMAPSDIYSFKYACGPDPAACLNYDFRKVRDEASESTADAVTPKNVEAKAKVLLAQYGRYASLSTTNVLLVPLGDDFRYNIKAEWEQQYRNYRKLFDFINAKKEWNAHVRFGTLADYFDEVHKRLQNASSLPSISGDFLPYSDIYASGKPAYWTGFYSTRPFYKKLSQELEHWLRASEILYSFAKTMVTGNDKEILQKDYVSLTSARQTLGLFQHHDAITGTSKRFVMEDYGRLLRTAITDTMSITSHITQILLMEKENEKNTWTSKVYPDVYKTVWNYPIEKESISTTTDGRKVILFNPLTVERTETIRLKVKSLNIQVVDLKGRIVPCQINPTWTESFAMSNSLFELIFVVTLKPLSFSTYNLVTGKDSEFKSQAKSIVSMYLKDDTTPSTQNTAFRFEKPKESDINIESPQLRAKFSPSGVLREIYIKENGVINSVNIDFRAYFPWLYHSGGYLFQPDSPNPVPLGNLTTVFPYLCTVKGPLVTELNIMYTGFFKFTVSIYNYKGAPPGLQLEVSADLSRLGKDAELVMRVDSDVKNGGVFYTDSNGLQMLRRTYVSSLPVEGNYYPATSAVYVEDDTSRLTLLVPHSHGVTSPSPGTMEVMIDRRIHNDDGRGMGEGVEDNRMITTSFWIVPESVGDVSSREAFSLSRKSHSLSLRSRYPVITLLTDSREARVVNPDVEFLSKAWPPDVHLVNLRTLPSDKNFTRPSDSSLLIVHERSDSCKTRGFVDKLVGNSGDAPLFSNVGVKGVEKTSLTGTLPFSKESGIANIESFSKLQSCKVIFR